MPFGLKVYNNDGDVTIDADYQNYRVIAAGSKNVSDTGAGSADATLTFSSAHASPPLVFVRGLTDHRFSAPVMSGSSGNWTGCTIRYAGPGGTFDYVIVDPNGVGAQSPETHGIQVFDAASNLAFDSRDKMMILHDVFEISPGEAKTRTSVTGAYMMLNDAGGMNAQPHPQSGYYLLQLGLMLTSDTVVDCDYMILGQVGGVGALPTPRPSTVLIATFP